MPLREDGRTVGVLCVFAPEARTWSERDVDALVELAASAVVELDLARVADDLERNRLRIGLAIDAAGVGGWDWDLTTGVLEWDDRLLDVFGVERHRFGATVEAFRALVHPDDVDRVTAALQRAVDTGGLFDAEYRVVRPDGRQRWVRGRGRALCDPTGRPVRVVGAAYDTTDVHEGDARVARVLESMSGAFFSMDQQWRLTYVNAEAEKFVGPRDALIGRSFWEAVPAARTMVSEQRYRDAVESGLPVIFEEHAPEPVDRWFEVRAWPTPDGLSVHFHEITERHRAQDLADAAAARVELLARTTQQLTEVLDARAALARLADLVVPDLADFSVVTLVDAAGMHDVGWAHRDPGMEPALSRYAQRRFAGMAPGAPVLRSLASSEPLVRTSGATEALLDVLRDDAAREALRELAPEGFWVLPVRARGRTLGLLTLYRGADRADPPAEDLATAREVASRAGTALDNARLYEQHRALSEELQRSLLTPPPEPDHTEVVVRYVPAAAVAQVGGDWYDSFLQSDGATVLVIGDVVGHDTAAVAAMGQLRGLLRGIAHTTGAGPAEVLQRLDAAMLGLLVTTTATAAVVRLEQPPAERDAGTTTLRWSSAGHPPPMVLRPDGVVQLLEEPEPDLLLGLDPTVPRQERALGVERGTTVLLYTDGLVERRRQSLDVGLDLLRRLLGELGHLPLQQLCDALLARMLPAHPEDDVALVAVRLHPQDRPRPAEAGPERIPPGVPEEP